ncbi:MAG: DUF2528 family protein [Candidatus Heimdallarchaeota archaeon]|nr:DUF2528 family protein [Candidatus Heimdallarchaeota archaeon]
MPETKINQYKIEYALWWEALVEIKDDEETMSKMKEMILFWMNGKNRIKKEKGDITTAFLKMLGETMITESMEYNTFGIREFFKEEEGWYDMDGSHGIEIFSVDTWNFDASDFSIESAEFDGKSFNVKGN